MTLREVINRVKAVRSPAPPEADLIEIRPEKAYPDSGAAKFFWGGKSAVMGEKPALKPYRFVPETYGRIIFCFPVWAGNPAPPVRTFIKENLEALRGKKLAAIVCFSGGGADKALMKLKRQLETEDLEAELILIDPKDKAETQKDDQIRSFCEKLKNGSSRKRYIFSVFCKSG